jgi:hypothetical protein
MVTIAVAGAALFFVVSPKVVTVGTVPEGGAEREHAAASAVDGQEEAPRPPSSPVPSSGAADEPKQPQLANPPVVVKGLYMTSWWASSQERVLAAVRLGKRAGVNAVVIDIKDYTGEVAYRTDSPLTKQSGAERAIRIARPNALIKMLHDEGVYVIGRISVFQDTVLATSHPEWALKNKTTGAIWKDRKGLAWLDAASRSVWDYNIAIAKDALERGFDEINFDYIRFASDGDLSVIGYPAWDSVTPRHKVIRNFFKYLREQLGNSKMSADLFGLVTVGQDDLGIGQIIQDAFPYFDAVAPMVYPSHYAPGFQGYKNPAKYPYEVVRHSMETALTRLKNYELGIMNQGVSSTPPSLILNSKFRPTLRPWLQVFDLGATYDTEMVKAQIQATDEALGAASSSPYYGGWLLWDPKNQYAPLRGF